MRLLRTPITSVSAEPDSETPGLHLHGEDVLGDVLGWSTRHTTEEGEEVVDEPIKVNFHLANGKTVTAIWDDEGADSEASLTELEAEINGKLTGKPSWFQFGELWVFTGAVSAIEIDY